MLQLPLARLSRRRVQPTNLLPTGVIITSNNHHRRLLPTDSFGPPNRSIPAMRTEPSLLCNQSFLRQDDTKGVGQALADSCGLSPKTVRSLTAKCSHLQSGDL